MRLIYGLILAGGLLSACATPAPVAGTQLADGSEKICRFTTGVGSAPGNRICATKAEWAVHDANDKQQSAELGHTIIQGVDSYRAPPGGGATPN